MDQANTSKTNARQEMPPTPPPKSPSGHYHQHADDMFDSPNTAEAFTKLEAAMDEVNLLYAPDTAERFARIEAYIDEAIWSATVDDLRVRRSKRFAPESHELPQHGHSSPGRRLRKRSTQSGNARQLAQPPVSSHSSASPKTAGSATTTGHEDVSKSQPLRDVHGPSKDHGRSSAGAHVLARTVPMPRTPDSGASYAGKEELHQEMDIFRSEEALKEFTNQAYEGAREKYM